MKKGFILLFVSILLFASCSYSQTKIKNKELEEFKADFSSANTKLKSKLLQIGQYKNDLSEMTYNHYIKLLRKNELISDKGIATFIQEADEHAFATTKNSFFIAIYSKELNAVVYDDANTAFVDYVKELEPNEPIPDLNVLITEKSINVSDN